MHFVQLVMQDMQSSSTIRYGSVYSTGYKGKDKFGKSDRDGGKKTSRGIKSQNHLSHVMLTFDMYATFKSIVFQHNTCGCLYSYMGKAAHLLKPR